jgi:transcription elongation factor Elf1
MHSEVTIDTVTDSEQKPFTCPWCGAGQTSDWPWSCAFGETHSRKCVCSACSKVFTVEYSIVEHKITMLISTHKEIKNRSGKNASN